MMHKGSKNTILSNGKDMFIIHNDKQQIKLSNFYIKSMNLSQEVQNEFQKEYCRQLSEVSKMNISLNYSDIDVYSDEKEMFQDDFWASIPREKLLKAMYFNIKEK